MDVVGISIAENAVRDCNANPADPQGSLTVTLKKLFGNPSRQKPLHTNSLSAKSKWTLPASHSSLHGPTPEAMVVQKKKRRASVFFPMVCFNLTVPSARFRELGSRHMELKTYTVLRHAISTPPRRMIWPELGVLCNIFPCTYNPENRAVCRNPSSLYMYQYYYLKCNKQYPDFTADLDNSTAQKEAPNDATFIHCVCGLQLQHWQSCRNGCPDITRDLRVDAASDGCEICLHMS